MRDLPSVVNCMRDTLTVIWMRVLPSLVIWMREALMFLLYGGAAPRVIWMRVLPPLVVCMRVMPSQYFG